MNPQFPLYIVSKGRWESRVTIRHLEAMRVPYHVIVEHHEFKQYSDVVGPYGTVLTLDPEFQRQYDAFGNLGAVNSKGSGPARNFAWEHSIANGHKWHWVMDDNIRGWYRLNNNLKIKCADGTVFKCMEDFVLRYENIGMAGPNYHTFANQRDPDIKPFRLNTRIYSCNLIRNDLPFRWRGRYNEDTDLSLRILKGGLCTVLFNAFLQAKMGTLSVKGGNTDLLYANGANKRAKSQMLVHMHPDVARMAWRFGRWHHFVDYGPFKSMRLIPRSDVVISNTVDNYGMRLRVDEEA